MKNIYKALAGFQQEVPAIHQGTKGYGYTYSDLKTIFKVINPILKKHDLGFTQLLDGTNIKTVIFHTESGESIESITEIPQGITLKGMNTFQINGSGITYYRRYSLSSALGLVTDVDSDATGEEKTTQAPPQQQPQVSTEQAIEAIAKLNNATDKEELTTVWKEVLTREERLHPDVIAESKKIGAKFTTKND
jgi:hypothetical protein